MREWLPTNWVQLSSISSKRRCFNASVTPFSPSDYQDLGSRVALTESAHLCPSLWNVRGISLVRCWFRVTVNTINTSLFETFFFFLLLIGSHGLRTVGHDARLDMTHTPKIRPNASRLSSPKYLITPREKQTRHSGTSQNLGPNFRASSLRMLESTKWCGGWADGPSSAESLPRTASAVRNQIARRKHCAVTFCSPWQAKRYCGILHSSSGSYAALSKVISRVSNIP